MAVDYLFPIATGSELGERHYVLVAAHECLILTYWPYAKVTVAIVGGFHLYVRSSPLKEWGIWRDARLIGIIGQFAMQDGGMGGVDPTLHCLKPVALLPDLGHVPVGLRRFC